jgi:hypothetical protein
MLGVETNIPMVDSALQENLETALVRSVADVERG